MKKIELDSKEENFNRFLTWLHTDRHQAGERYVTIWNGLIQFFGRKPCHQNFNCQHTEELTQETFDRVIFKIDENVEKYPDAPERCIYGYAKNVWREHLRDTVTQSLEPDLVDRPDDRREEANEKERSFQCLEQCLGQLPENERDIVSKYFACSGQEGTKQRTQLSKDIGITPGNLAVKALRIRKKLHQCIEDCLKKIFLS